MSGEDVLGGNSWEPYGYTNTAWGGQGVDPGITYQGGYTAPDASGIPSPADPAAWKAYQDAQHASTGQAQAVNRYQNMGNAANLRYAPDIDYSGAQRYNNMAIDAQGMGNDVRGSQTDSLALARAAAMGQAPSQAEMLSRNMLGQSLQSQLAGAASARGGSMAQAAAMRQASLGAAAFQQQGMNSIGAMRAQKMANARDQYGQQAYGIRAQDYTLAGQNIQQSAQAAQQQQIQASLDMQQRQMNQADQQYYEGLAWNTNNAMLNAGLGQSAQAQQSMQFQQQMAMQQQQQQQQMIAAAIGGTATLGAGAITAGGQVAAANAKANNNSGGGGGGGPTTVGYADGGPVAPGQTILVGEQGPEVIVPAQPAQAPAAAPQAAAPAGYTGLGSGLTAATPFFAQMAPGAGYLAAASGIGAHLSEAAMRDQQRAAQQASIAAQAEQKAQDDERAAMQAAERVQAMPATAHQAPPQVLAPAQANERQQSRMAALLDWALGRDRGIPQRAGGGPMPPGQPVLVGEQGPEVVQMQQPGMVLPATHPISQQVAQKQMTLADVAKLRQQADELERNLHRQMNAGPSVGPPQTNSSPTLAQAAMMGSPPLATNRGELMGGREDPYADYSAVTWGTGRQQPILDRGLMGGRDDPYAADAVLALEQYR